jgi:chemotaxis protein CheC
MSAPAATFDVPAAPAGRAGADEPPALTAAQRVAMRAVAHVGARHAAAALSQMTGGPVLLTVAAVRLERLDRAAATLDRGDDHVAVVRVGMAGDVAGSTLLVLPKRTAMRVAERLLRRPLGSAVALGGLERSAVMEAGNIVCGAYLHAIADGMGIGIVPSPPSLAVDAAAAVLAPDALRLDGGERMITVETALSMQDVAERLRGHFFLIPEPAALGSILRAAAGA